MSTAILIAGCGFGDETKGATVDKECRATGAHTVVRYNGGAQAGHNVVTADGRHHTFSQFGSGTFAGARTHLSRHMLVNPIFLLAEGAHLVSLGERDIYDRITVDEFALCTNPFQVSANRIREMARDGGRHGSCGMGIGETMADAIGPENATLYVGDLTEPDTARAKLAASRDRKMWTLAELHQKSCPVASTSWSDLSILARAECSCPFRREWEVIVDDTTIDLALERYAEFVGRVKIVGDDHLPEVMREGTTIFEGAQGVLLDQDYGFHPYTTWTDITFRNAFELLGVEGTGLTITRPLGRSWSLATGRFDGEVRRIGVLRCNHTRHGAGPFPTEDPSLKPDPREHNCNGPWQQNFRVGHFDLCLARYAIAALGGIDELALSHLDRIQDEQKVCVQYDYQGHVMHEPYVEEMWNFRARLDVREAATRKIMEYKPVYRTLTYSPEGFATEIAGLLGVRIGSLAYGPTAEDRRGL